MPELPADRDLTVSGADFRGADSPRKRLLLIACGALAREILALKEINGWLHMDLICLPAILHNHPEKIPDAVRKSVLAHQATYDQIFVLYADCGTGGLLRRTCEALGVEMLAGPHCYAFFEGAESFAARDEITVFYLTDFLARQFEAFVWLPLGLDRHPELRDIYFGNYTRVVYLAQTDDPVLTEQASDAARRLGLTFERRYTGYGDLATALSETAT